MNRYTQRTTGTIARAKIDSLLDDARQRVSSSGDISEVLSEIWTSIERFYSGLRDPISTALTLSAHSRRDKSEYSDWLSDVRRDLDIVFSETRSATRSLTSSFNYTKAITDALTVKAQKIALMAEDLALLNDTPSADVFVAGDRFADDSLIDRTHSSVTTQASVSPGGGAATLQTVTSARVVAPEDASIDVQVGPGFTYDPSSWTSGEVQDDPDQDYRVYEGRYFSYAGRMEPAGGALRWVTRHVTQSGREVEPGLYGTDSDTPPIPESRTVILPDSPTLDELQNVRRLILDSNPDTYWQIETTYNPFRVVDEDSFLDTYADSTATQRAAAFRQLVADLDDRDFDIILTVDLGDVATINWLNLQPHNFGDEQWLEILNIETSTNTDGPWTVIEGLFDNRHENLITPDANAELTDAEVAATLSPSRYQYAGQGVWQFAPREARFVRLTIRQRVPVPSPYEVLRYKMSRHMTTTVTKKRQRGLFS